MALKLMCNDGITVKSIQSAKKKSNCYYGTCIVRL